MNRRAFLAALVGAAAAAADPERLLWVPGRKLISIPAPRFLVFHTGAFCLTFGPSLISQTQGSSIRVPLRRVGDGLWEAPDVPIRFPRYTLVKARLRIEHKVWLLS